MASVAVVRDTYARTSNGTSSSLESHTEYTVPDKSTIVNTFTNITSNRELFAESQHSHKITNHLLNYVHYKSYTDNI